MTAEHTAYLRTTVNLRNSSSTHLWITHIFESNKFLCEDDFEKIRKEIKPYIHIILQDLEIYHGMTYEKAREAIHELSLLSTLYVNSNSGIYTTITDLIRVLTASYPLKNFAWTEAPKNYFLSDE